MVAPRQLADHASNCSSSECKGASELPMELTMPRDHRLTNGHASQGDAGFILVEVMVSALILVLASLAIMQALDRSDALAGNQQRRTIAANVAQAELERIRSLPIEDIANLRTGGSGARTETLNGVPYAVATESRWRSDGRDTVNCGAANGGLDYLQVTTSVSWPGMGKAKPLSMTTLVTPSNRSTSEGNGSLSVQIVDADNNGVPNLPVSLVGPDSFTDNTDADGCVAWGNLDASASWTLSFSRGGYINKDGVQNVSETIALAGGTTTGRQYLYDRAGFIKPSFKTYLNASDVVSTDQSVLTISHSNMTSDRTPVFPVTDVWDSSLSAPPVPLFPFASEPYQVYAGSCSATRPPAGSTGLGQLPATVSVTRGLVQGLFVVVPAMQITVRKSDGSPAGGALVKVTDPCGTVHTRYTNLTTGALDTTTDSTPGPSGEPPAVRATSAGDVGFPYFAAGGKICASLDGKRFEVSTGVSNTNFNGMSSRVITLPSGGNASC